MKKNKLFIFISVIIILLFVFLSLFLTSCNGKISGVESVEVINLIFPNIWVIIATIIASFILVVTLYILMWKPFNNMIEKRREIIIKQFEDANNKTIEAEKNLVEAKNKNIEANNIAKNIIDNSNKKAQQIILDAEKNAKDQANKIIINANQELSNQKQKIEHDLTKQSIDTAFEIASKLIEKNISKSDNQKYIDEVLKALDENK